MDAPRTAAAGPRRAWIALGFLAAAFALRAAFLLASSDASWPHSMRYEGDAPVWARWAAAMTRGEAFEHGLPLRAPGAAYLLRALGGLSFESAKLVWCALSAATVALLYLVAARLGGDRVAAIAACWLALSFGDHQLATSLNNEAPYQLLLLVSIAATEAWIARPGLALALALGLVHGAAALLRAEHVAFVALAACWSLARARRGAPGRARALAGVAATLLATLAACAPWAWQAHGASARFNRAAAPIAWESWEPSWSPDARAAIEALPAFAREPNARYLADLRRAAGDAQVDADDVRAFFDDWGYTPEPIPEWTLVTWKGALDFALANHPGAGGGFSRAALGDGREPEPALSFARPSHLRLVNHGFAVGAAWLLEDPARGAALLVAKLRRFADGATLGFSARNLPYGRAGLRRPVDLTVPRGGAAWRLALGAWLAAGAWVAWRRRTGALLALALGYKLAITLAFYGYARQAVSIGFVFAFLGALALDELYVGVQRRSALAGRLLAWGGALLVLALALVDVAEWLRPTALEVRSTAAAPRIVSPSEWGSVESVDELVLEPR